MKLSYGCLLFLILGFVVIVYLASGAAERTAVHAIDVVAEQANRPLSPTELIAQNQAIRDGDEEGGRGMPFVVMTCLSGLALLALAFTPFLGRLADALKQARLFRKGGRPHLPASQEQTRPSYQQPELPAANQPAALPPGGIQWFDED